MDEKIEWLGLKICDLKDAIVTLTEELQNETKNHVALRREVEELRKRDLANRSKDLQR